ncbi:MAG TPA: hypothetical protein VFE62_10070 [Gemmataceae bacterium]|nr:hypothetical protein [Gemmataceae bacterium]
MILKIAVIAVTLLWIASLIALALGNTRLHGRINYVFFGLTLTALFALEVVMRVIKPGLFDDYAHHMDQAMAVHLTFSVPAAVLLFVMLFTGIRHLRRVHIAAGILFSVLWIGTFVTGVFFLRHELP